MILETIRKEEYSSIRSLFVQLEKFQPMCTAVLEGIWPGDIWVDNHENPQTALMITFLSGGGAAWCFLTGKPDNEDFNKAVNIAIFEGKIAGVETGAFLVTCSSDDWFPSLDEIGQPRQPVLMLRHHHISRKMTYDWRKNLPGGYAIQPMTTDLIRRDNLRLTPQVKTTLEKWLSIDDNRFQDFGYIVEHENQVVSWATVDFVSSGAGDLGFETLPEFQKRGLGSAVAGAALEYGQNIGVEVHWTCAADNIGSQKTAKKLGLVHDRDYTMYFFALDFSEHLSQLAYSHLARGDYQQAIEGYETLFASESNIPIWAYFDTAQAWAGMGEREHALKYLRMAAKNGWSAVEMTEQTPEFQFLKDLPEWIVLIERILKNKQKRESM